MKYNMKKLLLNLFSHRTLALLRWDLYFLKIRFLNTLLFRQKKLEKVIAKPTEKKYLNLGSGPRGILNDSWINVDGFKDTNVQYLCDFTKKLPFKNEVFDGIFCEHVLEHFDYENGKKLLTECKRILKIGGTIRIIVPDGEKILESYFKEPNFLLEYKHCKTIFPIEAINSWFYQRYEHQCIYDAGYLTDLMTKIGFSQSGKTTYLNLKYNDSEMVLDDSKYSWESLYVEGVK